MNSPARSSPGGEIFVIAHAARQLAAAAAAAGYRPLVADCFGDRDTRALATAYYELPHRGGVLNESASCELLERIVPPGIAIVWGGGFEGHPVVLRLLAARGELLGSDLDLVARMACPEQRASCLAQLEIPQPPQAYDPRPESAWLLKTRGGAGGQHVRDYAPMAPVAPHDYLQQRVRGGSYSLSFLAAGGAVTALGFNRHLNLQPAPTAPYRYAGAVTPAELPTSVRTQCLRYAHALARCGLRGLGGFDFVCEGTQVQVVDVNPRPTATCDLLLQPAAAFRAHVAASRASAMTPLAYSEQACGHLVAYAPHPIRIPKSLNWPSWSADQPLDGTLIPAHSPVCTLAAAGATIATVEALLHRRLLLLWQLLALKPCG